ncbi:MULTISPECIES: bifunctional alpha/beta hydrolase/OsmC family protein [Halocynthiibacter]|uniref:Bifunctional alpha/beta hydrolase/OsmC family protein n=1 Tax=Halocynthiibacter halioticoli TaxID=2986804 RepID=A0AAE3IXR2_9RHOB|nr:MULTISPECIES: bifunctional alpha/beta hydrolase/OsmC family protein [Halocynthiibacter]MCV6824058.1 bifunctional alpha/beta hydrolase/OsmC family protein [Halocynthiibacter halioticoli]MCW4057059.1 bifunctional alpha/beta hydrolase/OsmC family protein [Halocynthiibacter sp. SDUM655004]
MPIETHRFAGHDGSSLAARLDTPEGPHLATAIFAHCFSCGKDIRSAKRISSRLASMGIAVLRFDFTGLFGSEGSFDQTSFTSNAQDLVAAAAYMESLGMPASMLIGHSLGGAAVLRAAQELPDIRAIATLGAPADPAHVTHLFGPALEEIERNGSAQVSLGGVPVNVGEAFLQDLKGPALLPTLKDLKAALLVLHAPRDEIVSIDNAAEIFMAARHPKSFITLDTADHMLTDAADAEYAAEMIATWAGRYIDLSPPAPPIGAPEGVVRVTEADHDGFLQDISAGPHHHITADEPLAYGGTNKGMSPYGLLSAALGACTSMTLRMFARRKKWPLASVYVDVTHNKVHAQDATTCNTSTEKIDRFTRRITLEGPLAPEQSARLLEIADRCPVHQTLERTSVIETVLAEVKTDN